MAADPQHVLKHGSRMASGLQGLRQHHVVEGVVRVVDKVGVGVALDHRKALGDALVDAFARQLDAAPVDAAALQELQKLAVAAADIEHARARLDHVGHHEMVDAGIAGPPCGLRHGEIAAGSRQHAPQAFAMPRAAAAESKKPATIWNSSGSSSRKASWPLSVAISANETRAPAALRACTIARDSEVGNNQSLVKEITQNRVVVLLKALASTPSQSSARSK